MALEPIMNLLIPILANQLISSTSAIRIASSNALDKLIETCDNQAILQSLTSILQFGGNPKMKPVLLEKLMCNGPLLVILIRKLNLGMNL